MEPKGLLQESNVCRNLYLLCSLSALVLLLAPGAALADPVTGACFDQFECSSNDLVVLQLTASGAGSDPTCPVAGPGNFIDLEITTQIVVQSGSDPSPEAQQRYDVGLWAFIDPPSTCGRDVLTNANTDPDPLNSDDDACGDITTVPLTHAAIFTGVPCVDSEPNGFVDPFVICQSWGNQEDQIGGAGGCDIDNVFPGTNPKCSCVLFDPQISVPFCGNGIVEQVNNEECDDGDDIDDDECGNDCKLPVCGDGDVEGDEECDEGGGEGGQCCNPDTCQLIGECGNGVVECAEECDDGNQDNTDTCTNVCQNAQCGDGFVQQNSSEQCDDGNQVDLDCCDNACQLPICGNGETECTEECDDGGLNGQPGQCGIDCVPTMGEIALGSLALLLIGLGAAAARKGSLV